MSLLQSKILHDLYTISVLLRMFNVRLILIVGVICTQISFPQTTDSLELIQSTSLGNLLSSRFVKQLSTFNLNNRFNVSKTWGDFDILATENFNSTFVRTSEKSIRDEQKLSLLTKYRIMQNLTLGMGYSSSIFSDSRRIEINQASENEVSLFSKFEPYENLYLRPFFGYLDNKQVRTDDNGLVYGADVLMNRFNISDLMISSDIRFHNEDISPRKNLIRNYGLLLHSEFTKEIDNVISATYSKNRKDFYFEADSITSYEFNVQNNIQSRIETNYWLQDSLRYDNLFKAFSLDIAGAVNWRKIDRDTRYKSIQNATTSIFDSEIKELNLNFESILGYQSKNFNGLLRLIYSERDEKNLAKRLPDVPENIYQDRADLEARKNNNSVRTSISFLGDWKISRADNIYFSLLHNKLRYDTPSKQNFDDRDELLSIIRLRYIRKFTPFFEGFVNTEGTYNQTVYIFSEKSSNNNINRILKLAAGGSYTGKNLSSLNSLEVSANYTVYDFQDLNPNIKSYSFRQFTALDSTSYLFSKRLKLSFYGYVKLSEQGDLKWDEFKSRPTRYLQEIYCEPRIAAIFQMFQYSVGIRFFFLSTFGYKSNVKFLDSEFRSIGPIAEILIAGSSNLYLKILGWYEFITITGKSKKEQTNLNVEMSWSF